MTRKLLISNQDFIDYVQDSLKTLRRLPKTYDQIKVVDISGNINRVRQVTFLEGNQPTYSVVVKTLPEDGRLERYPDICFPVDRLKHEAGYYQLIQQHGLAWMPECFAFDDQEDTLLLEDLSPALTLESWVKHHWKMPDRLLETAGHQLGEVHARLRSTASKLPMNLSNQHNLPFIFSLPLQQMDTMRQYWINDAQLNSRVSLQKKLVPSRYRLLEQAERVVHAIYHSPLLTVTHGDLHSGSLFVLEDHYKVIDAELSDRCACWFDTGIFLGHCRLLSAYCNQRIDVTPFYESYISAFNDASANLTAEEAKQLIQLSQQVAGFEIIRRLVGIANVDYMMDDAVMSALVERAVDLILA